MQYTQKAWRPTGAEEVTLTRETRPSCPGNWTKASGACAARPDHVVVYLANGSGLPGQGEQQVHYACHRHLHTLLKHVEAVGTFAMVSAYNGV